MMGLSEPKLTKEGISPSLCSVQETGPTLNNSYHRLHPDGIYTLTGNRGCSLESNFRARSDEMRLKQYVELTLHTLKIEVHNKGHIQSLVHFFDTVYTP